MRRVVGIMVVMSLGAGMALAAGACKSNSISQTNNGGTTIGAAGGIVAGPDNTEIRIPAGALAKDVTFDIQVAEPGQYPAQPAMYSFDGKVYAFLPHGTQFQTPVVVSLPHAGGSNLVGLHADTNGSWTVAQTTVTSDAVEISTPSLSFYAVGTSGGQAEGGTPTCSGRGPVSGAPAGTVQFTMGGTIPATYWSSGNGMPVDTSTITDGYAGPPPFNKNQFAISLTSYTQACGFAKNNDLKIGGSTLNFALQSKPTGPVTIPPSMLQVSGTQVPSSMPAGTCGGSGASGSPSSMGTGVTINAIDGTHVSGSFDVFVNGTMELKGTFDVPICPYDTTINPTCCVP